MRVKRVGCNMQQILPYHTERMYLRTITILVVIFCVSVYAENPCFPGVCKKVRCPSIRKCNPGQKLVRKATRCRCCDVCVPLLKQGEPCLRIKRFPATARCMRGLRCVNRRCVVPKPHRHGPTHTRI